MIRNSDQYIPGVVLSTQNRIEEVFALSDPSGKGRRRKWKGTIDSEDFPGLIYSNIEIRGQNGNFVVSRKTINRLRDPKVQKRETYTLSPITIRFTDHMTQEQFFLTADDPRIKSLNTIITRVKEHIVSSRPEKG